jgi:transposase
MDDLPPVITEVAEDALTTGRKSVRMPRVEVITRGERRRVWTLEQKREIVAESLGPDLTPTEVAHKHGISSGLLYNWRRQILGERMALASRVLPGFTQVEIEPAQGELTAERLESMPPGPVVSPRAPGLIEVVLPGGITLRVDAEVDEKALRRVLAALLPR